MSSPAPSKNSTAIRIAQIGIAGGIGWAHLNEQEKNPNFITVAGFDAFLDNPKVAEAAERIKKAGGKIYATYEELLQDPQVEAVSLATPHFVHRDMAVAAFKAGKHVICEKPMATHPDDCKAMFKAQRKSGKVGAVQMQHVGRSSFLQLRDALANGAIGKIKEVFLSSLWFREDSYYGRNNWAGRKMMDANWNLDGVMFNQAVHYINQALILLAPGPLPAVASAKNVEVALYRFHDAPTLEMEDTAFVKATLKVPGSPRLIMAATTASKNERHSIDIIGNNGRALWNGTGYLFPKGQPSSEFHDDNREFDGTSRIYNSFHDAIRNGSIPMTSFEQIMKTTQFIVGIYEAANWQIKKAPWSAAESLHSQVIPAFRNARALPASLENKPDWA